MGNIDANPARCDEYLLGKRKSAVALASQDFLDEAAWEESGLAALRVRAFEPAVVSLLEHVHDVARLQLQLNLALRRVRVHTATPATW